MKVEITNLDDNTELEYQLATCDIDNPQYLIMSDRTLKKLTSMSSFGFSSLLCYYYDCTIPIAICNQLKLGEIEIV
jgi:hypothetical protein